MSNGVTQAMRCIKGKAGFSSDSQSENYSPAEHSSPILSCFQVTEGRPRILTLERESIPWLTHKADSQHFRENIREKSVSVEINWKR